MELLKISKEGDLWSKNITHIQLSIYFAINAIGKHLKHGRTQGI